MSIKLRFYLQRQDFCLDVDLELPSTGITALFGKSGCGKTTLLRLIAGLEFSENNYFSIDSTIWQDNTKFLKPHQRPIGYVLQEPSLFRHLSVKQNIEFGFKRLNPTDRKITLDRAIALLNIGHLLHRKPHQLSGGEQQRIAIARALAVSPKLLLLDEPLAFLDETRKQEILPFLESIQTELSIPIIYVSHSHSEVARLASHLVLMEAGKAKATGSAEKLLSDLSLVESCLPNTKTVIATTATAYDAEFKLTSLSFADGTFIVATDKQLLNTKIWLQIKASDISLTLTKQTDTSILNIFVAKVLALTHTKASQCLVKIAVGATVMIAKITNKSAVALKLKPNKTVYAQIKAVSLAD